MAETRRRGRSAYLPACLPAWRLPGQERSVASARSLPPSPRALSRARTGLTHPGRVARVGRPQRAEGQEAEEAGRAHPPGPGRRRRQGAGETDSDLPRERPLPAAGGPCSRPLPPGLRAGTRPGLGRGFLPRRPAALWRARGCQPRQRLRLMETAAPPRAQVTLDRPRVGPAAGGELGEGDRRTPGDLGTPRQRWPGS